MYASVLSFAPECVCIGILDCGLLAVDGVFIRLDLVNINRNATGEQHCLNVLQLTRGMSTNGQPALPPDKFLTRQKPGRLIRARQQPDHITTNTICDYLRNNNRAYKIPRCRTDQLRNSFFIKTAADRNHLDNTTVHAASVQRFKAL